MSLALAGLSYGLLLFMLASGLALIYGLMGVMNFAHGSFYMLGAYLAYSVSTRAGFAAGLLAAPVLTGLLGAAVARWGVRAASRRGHLAEMLFTVGLALVIGEAVKLIWGPAPVPYALPPGLRGMLGPLPAGRLLVVGVALAAFAALAALARSRAGLAVRAALAEREMVAALGHDVGRLATAVFATGCALAGLAGALAGALFTTEPGMAGPVGALAFAAVVMGGLGSVPGALAASLLIGLVQAEAVGLPPPCARAAPALPFLLLVAVLAVRPRGLAGRA